MQIERHENYGKLNKCIYKVRVDSLLLATAHFWTQYNVLYTLICWKHCIFDICIALLFQVLNIPSKHVKFGPLII